MVRNGVGKKGTGSKFIEVSGGRPQAEQPSLIQNNKTQTSIPVFEKMFSSSNGSKKPVQQVSVKRESLAKIRS